MPAREGDLLKMLNKPVNDIDLVRLKTKEQNLTKTAEGEMSFSPSSTNPTILDPVQTHGLSRKCEVRNKDDINKFY